MNCRHLSPNYFNNLNFSETIHHGSKRPLNRGDIKENACGVIHLSDVKWLGSAFRVRSANVQMYVTPISYLKELKVKKAELKNDTLHKIMMIELGLWKKFELFKNRICNDKGELKASFDLCRESDLYYGFTRSGNLWKGSSCTLNSWFDFYDQAQEPQDANVLQQAGVAGSENSYAKRKYLNLMPQGLWQIVLPRLDNLIKHKTDIWSIEWALKTDEKEREMDETDRMRRLVFDNSTGSKMFQVWIQSKQLGLGGIPAMKALKTVLEEETGWGKRCSETQVLSLYDNSLNDKCISCLSPTIALCSNLEELRISRNLIGVAGVTDLVKHLPSKLKFIALTDNSLGNDGVAALAKYLPKNLEYLWLKKNNIGDSGVKDLAEHLPCNLKGLELEDNAIADAGVEVLLKHLPKTIERVNLNENTWITDKCKWQLIDLNVEYGRNVFAFY